MIEVNHLTLKYSSGKGVFDLDFEVKDGTVMGYLGPNGAGKTTTIRMLMGFMKQDSGTCRIDNLDSFKDAEKIKRNLGYIPGEIAFPNGMKCMEFLKYQAELRNLKDHSRMKELIERFELDTKGNIKQFSKGMKQKVGIVTAFMHDPKVIILDEPTSGLDPLMQNKFIDLILEEKRRGKTILMSSHIFEEIERTSDNVLIIKDGRIVAKSDISNLKKSKQKSFIIHTDESQKLQNMNLNLKKIGDDAFEVNIKGNEVDQLVKQLSHIHVTGLDIKEQNLEEIFLNFYGKESK